MNKLKQKLIHFLSDPSHSDKDFDQLVYWLKTGNIEEITTKVEEIRTITKMSKDSSYTVPLDDYINYNRIDTDRSIEVERLLIIEAHLTKEEAKKLLANRFNTPLNPNQRIAFNKWVETLGERVGWSELLHVAHLIRDDRVHKKHENPWPLQQND